MPIPRPSPNESKESFISRCIEELSQNDPGTPKDTITAICYNQWNEKPKVASMANHSPEHGIDCDCCK